MAKNARRADCPSSTPQELHGTGTDDRCSTSHALLPASPGATWLAAAERAVLGSTGAEGNAASSAARLLEPLACLLEPLVERIEHGARAKKGQVRRPRRPSRAA